VPARTLASLCLAALRESAAGLNLGEIVITIVSGVLTFVVARYLFDLYETGKRVMRLRRSLACDCFAIIQSMKRVRHQANEFDTIAADINCFEKATELYNGFPISGPLDQTKELIPLVDPDEGSLITYFLDRWDRFNGIESLYRSAHATLVVSAAKVTAGAEDKRVHELLFDEYWSQLAHSLRAMRECAEDISYVACRLIRTWQAEDDELTDISSVSLDHWKTWEQFAKDETDCNELWELRHS
jgi:hypothetical protein